MKNFFALVLALGFTSVAAGAQMASAPPKLSGHPMASELAFVKAATTDLQARFPTTASANKAGYIRFTDEDDTGAISYANMKWTSADAAHPSQLWYDVNGHLIGADYSVLQADSPKAPSLWGIDPARWETIPAHVHYGLVGPNGTTTYGAMRATGTSPTFSTVVAAGKAKKDSDVRFVFLFPAIWDLQVWLIRNPDGVFAEKNPDLKPSAGAKMSM
jgi:hypothetical protein